MLNFGLHALRHAIAVVIEQREIDGGDLRSVASLTGRDQLFSLNGGVTGPANFEGVAAHLTERWIGGGYGLHVASDARVGHYFSVGRAGNLLAICDRVRACQ